MTLTGPEARALRQRNGWSLQMLATYSGINKAYLSEFENGHRVLNDESLEQLASVLEAAAPAGKARPTIQQRDGHNRLVFVDARGQETLAPDNAFLEWTEADGSTYRMFIGKR
jgi:transcriptional regulator with XRE-family HTH domain